MLSIATRVAALAAVAMTAVAPAAAVEEQLVQPVFRLDVRFHQDRYFPQSKFSSADGAYHVVFKTEGTAGLTSDESQATRITLGTDQHAFTTEIDDTKYYVGATPNGYFTGHPDVILSKEPDSSLNFLWSLPYGKGAGITDSLGISYPWSVCRGASLDASTFELTLNSTYPTDGACQYVDLLPVYYN